MSARYLAACVAVCALVFSAAAAGTTGTGSRLPTDPAAVANALSCSKVASAAGRRQCARLAAALADYNGATNDLSVAAARLNTAGDALLAATKRMQETQLSFNLQYIQLQSQMQNENRQFTAVSNIMKTKHDTVKNSISNIR
jgi:hypothetical protein